MGTRRQHAILRNKGVLEETMTRDAWPQDFMVGIDDTRMVDFGWSTPSSEVTWE